MPVQIQLPGYKNHETALDQIVKVAGAGAGIYGAIQKGALESEQTKAAQLANTQKQSEMDIYKQNQDPNSQLSQLKTQANVAGLSQLANLVKDKDPDTFSQIMGLKNTFQNGVPQQMPEGQYGPGQVKKLSGQEQDAIMASPLVEGIKPVIEKMKAETGYNKTIDAANIHATAMLGTTQQRDERLHNDNLKQINRDPQIVALTTGANNLNNAITNFKNGGATTQEFAELQQAVRANAGIKSGGGVSERQETYLKSLGINKDKFMQFISGDPQSVLQSDPKFAEQILGVANLELQNKAKQANVLIDKLSAGHSNFYKLHPDLRDDYAATIKQAKGAISIPGQTHTQDKEAVDWAKANPDDPRSPAILKANGL